MRTTLDIERPVLEDLKKLQKIKSKPLGKIASSLLATTLKQQQSATSTRRQDEFSWFTAPMPAHVDIADKDALRRIPDKR
ncbi:MAG: hypothetical protein ACLFU4_02425 [Opitutales bacterium]